MGENTANDYYYKPDLGASGQAEIDLFNAGLDTSDAALAWVHRAAKTLYIGDRTTNGSWRFRDDGTNLIIERRESGTWNEKGAFTAT